MLPHCDPLFKAVARSLCSRVDGPVHMRVLACMRARFQVDARAQTEGGASVRVLDVVKAAAGQIFVHKVEVTSGCNPHRRPT